MGKSYCMRFFFCRVYTGFPLSYTGFPLSLHSRMTSSTITAQFRGEAFSVNPLCRGDWCFRTDSFKSFLRINSIIFISTDKTAMPL